MNCQLEYPASDAGRDIETVQLVACRQTALFKFRDLSRHRSVLSSFPPAIFVELDELIPDFADLAFAWARVDSFSAAALRKQIGLLLLQVIEYAAWYYVLLVEAVDCNKFLVNQRFGFIDGL